MKNTTEAQQRYNDHMENLAHLLGRLKTEVEYLQDCGDDADWCDVSFASAIRRRVKEVHDQVFREGEYKKGRR